jgi:UDP-N-acetylmuramate: L-alanyl-gamma-D-glutamyl-meso-diaminopimelate ligase
MRGLALAARELGYTVTGTDEGAYPPGSDWLDEHDFTWWRTPAATHLRGVDEVIISGHIQPEHKELVAAQKQGIPIRTFPELVAELTARERRIVVSGTHGKTTTTSLITWILEAAGRHPDYLIGIKPHNFESSVRLAGAKVAVIEGDEYRSSQLDEVPKFLHYRPDVLVVTSIEMDHPDFYDDLEAITKRFKELTKGMTKDGRLLVWQGSEAARALTRRFKGTAETYGLADADWSAEHVRFEPEGLRFTLKHHREALGELAVPLFGEHNVLNAIAASAVALEEGVPFEVLQRALEEFKGATRRFDRVTEPGDPVLVLDDYAHHPAEVETTVRAASLHFPGRVIAVFKPHTFSRTKELLKEYQQSFKDADLTFITEIESARESGKEKTVSGADIARGAGKDVKYIADRGKLLEAVLKVIQPGDTVLCMSVSGNDSFAQAVADAVHKENDGA